MSDLADEKIKLSNVQKVVAKRMYFSVHNTAQVTFNSACKFDKLMKYHRILKADNPDISIQDMIIFSLIDALKVNPRLNSTFENDNYQLHKNIDLNLAISLGDDVLVAPQIHNSEELTLGELIVKRKELKEKAINNRLSSREMRVGSFTISNLGNSPVLGFSPIINIPQVAILGIAGLESKLISSGEDNGFTESKFLNFSLTVDHRVINGSTAVNFIKSFIWCIENFNN